MWRDQNKGMVLFVGALSTSFLFLIGAVIVSHGRSAAGGTAKSDGDTQLAGASLVAERPEDKSKPRVGAVVSSQKSEAEVLGTIINRKLDAAKQGYAFSNTVLIGSNAVVYDINSDRVLFGKDEREAVPLASITKIMTIITAADVLSPSSSVVVTPEALATEGEYGLAPYSVWDFRLLADFALIASSNDAAAAIAMAAGEKLSGPGDPLDRFVAAMNAKAQEIGLETAHFINPTGLDIDAETEPGAVASALDVAKLFAYALEEYPEALAHTRLSEYDLAPRNGGALHIENTNEIANELPGLVASKTGYTLQAGGNLAVVVDAGLLRPVAIVVLGSTPEGRFADVSTLYGSLRQYID